MKVLYVLDRYPVLSQTFVSLEIEGLRARGHDVKVVALDDNSLTRPDSGDAQKADLILHNLGLKDSLKAHFASALASPSRYGHYVRLIAASRGENWRGMLRAPVAARYVTGNGVQHMRVHFGWSAGLVSRAIQVLNGCPRSITFHALDIYVNSTNVALKAEDATVVNVCVYNARLMEERYAVHTDAVIPCGVAMPRDARESQAKPDELLFVGRLVEKKGTDTLIQAVREIASSRPSIRLRIVGEGPESETLKALVARLSLNEQVEFLGSLEHEAVLERMNTTTCFVLPCRVARDGDADSQPLVLKEAMARGVPVITTSVTGIPELVDDTCGWMAEPDDVAGLANAIGAVLKDPLEAQRRASVARQRVRESFSIDGQVDGVLEIIGK